MSRLQHTLQPGPPALSPTRARFCPRQRGGRALI